MKKGIHFLYGLKNSGDKSLREIVRHLAKLGCQLIEVSPDSFINGLEDTVEFVKFSRDLGTDIAFCCGLPKDCDLTSANKNCQDKGVDYIHNLIKIMDKADIHLMTGTSWTVWPSTRTSLLTLDDKKEIIERTADVYAKALSPIVDCGIKSAIEPMNRFENYLINTSAEGVEFCQMVGNKNLGLLLDCFHMSIEEEGIVKSIKTAGDRLFHLHLAERNRSLPGFGDIDWDSLFIALKEVNYSGCLGIESFEVPEGGIATSVGLWRKLTDENYDDRLKKSLKFLDGLEKKYLNVGN